MIPTLGFFVPFAIRCKTAAIQIRHKNDDARCLELNRRNQGNSSCALPDEDKKDAIPDIQPVERAISRSRNVPLSTD
jgi:hypothetical protein